MRFCMRRSVVAGDDELDLLLEGVYQSRLVHHIHQHTRRASNTPLRLFGYVRDKRSRGRRGFENSFQANFN